MTTLKRNQRMPSFVKSMRLFIRKQLWRIVLTPEQRYEVRRALESEIKRTTEAPYLVTMPDLKGRGEHSMIVLSGVTEQLTE
jgi:hypothetical protein